MLPSFNGSGNLPPGVHWADWSELTSRFGVSAHRRRLLVGLRRALLVLRAAGCRTIYVDGSFVTLKEFPNDYDACWDVTGVDPTLLDPVFLEFSNGRAAQKLRFGGEFLPAQLPEGMTGRTFLEFFQIDKVTGETKGIVAFNLLLGGGL